MNDSHIWKESTLNNALETNNLELPNKAVFVGNDAFPLTTNLLKQYSRYEGLVYKEKVLNYRLSRAREVLQNAFGIMAFRFRVPKKPVSVSLDKIPLLKRPVHHITSFGQITYT